jgi:hypothetical protein
MIKQMNPHNCGCIPTQVLLASLSIIGKYKKNRDKAAPNPQVRSLIPPIYLIVSYLYTVNR